jgi:enoyl-CoA hydratase/carnithine racemase
MSEDPPPIRLDVTDGVAVIRIERPRMNALNAEIQSGLQALAAECTERSDVAAVVLTGGPEVFASGADIKEMEHLTHADMVAHSAVLQRAFAAVAGIPKPVVAAVNGYALGGGCELALCADIRIAAEDATLGQPEIKLGIIPGAGGTQRLTRLIGTSRAKDLIFTGRLVGAAEALSLGLVDRVLPAAAVLGAAMAWAAQFVGGPALALRAAKQSIDTGSEVDLGTGLEIERAQFAALFATEDRAIGMRSFIEKRPGRAPFVGR